MPYSLDTYNSLFKNHISKLEISSFLDVGAGSGKYGKLIKESFPSASVLALEPTQKYIEEFGLEKIYDTVYCQKIQDFTQSTSRNRYGAVIFGDVLEHLFRNEAIDYIDYFLYRSDWVFVIWPTFMPQDDAMDNTLEIHKSNFAISELSSKFDVHYFTKTIAWFNFNDTRFPHAEYNYCLIRGHITNRTKSL